MTGVRLSPGDQAPDFTLPDADGNQVSLAGLRGQRVIVYFYPAAMTPGCTKEACDFTVAMPDLTAEGVAVLGISDSSKAGLLAQLNKLGTNLLTVTPGQTFFGQSAQLPAAADSRSGSPRLPTVSRPACAAR